MLPFLLESYLLFCVTDDVLEWCALVPFSHKPFGFYCMILHSLVIFWNLCFVLQQNWLFLKHLTYLLADKRHLV